MKYPIAIIGGGPAGYTAAEAAGKAGLSVVLFEKNSVGGVCLNEGCIPTKTLLYSAKVYDYARACIEIRCQCVPEASVDLPKDYSPEKQRLSVNWFWASRLNCTAQQVTVGTGRSLYPWIAILFVVERKLYECEHLIFVQAVRLLSLLIAGY